MQIQTSQYEVNPKQKILVDNIITFEKDIELQLNKQEICTQGFRLSKGKLIPGVPRRKSEDCLKFCALDHCDGL